MLRSLDFNYLSVFFFSAVLVWFLLFSLFIKVNVLFQLTDSEDVKSGQRMI